MTQQNKEQFTKPVGNANEINELLRRYGVKFGIYKNGVFNEQFFPFAPIILRGAIIVDDDRLFWSH